jgi:membrane-associated phospholipid phosphatase
MNPTFLKILILHFIVLFFTFSPLLAQETNATKVGAIQKTGDLFLFTMPLATLGTALIIGDKEGAWQFTKGLLTTCAVTYGLKLSINKERPDMSNNNSFPSGHTAATFHSAGFIHKRYGFKYSIPAYVLAGFTAASRIDSKKHDIFDVLAGATIGLGSNLLFTKAYQQKHMELTFNSNKGDYLLGFNYNF